MTLIPKEQTEQKIEIISAVMLAVIIVAIAWCAYQSTLWNGIQTFKLRDTTSASRQVTMYTIQQDQRTSLDRTLFNEYIKSLYHNDTKLSKFFLDSMRPELRTVIQAWLETNPFENPDAPRNPFVMEQYNKTFVIEAEKFAKVSADTLEEAQQANKNSDNYTLMTVIYASVLFIGSILGKMVSKQVRLILLYVGLGMTSVATIIVIFMPIAAE